MLTSAQQIFSDDQNLTSSGASTNVLDLGAPGTVIGAPAALTRDIGKGQPIPLLIRLTADTGGTSPTLDIAVQVDTVENFASPTTVKSLTQVGDESAGFEIYTDVYLPEDVNQRYLRLNYTLGGTSPDYTVWAGIIVHKSSNPTVPGA